MEISGKIYISSNYKKEDYKKLELKIDSDEETWGKAINIFNDRIRGRYLDPIDILLRDDNYNATGFAVMAINCLLIDTLCQFKNGAENTNRHNKREYTTFLRLYMQDVFDEETKAEKFYTDIRCGILHSAQTKNGSQLTYNKEYVVKLFDEKKKISVDVVNFTRLLKEYYDKYIEKLVDGRNDDRFERENFIKKMDFICKNEI